MTWRFPSLSLSLPKLGIPLEDREDFKRWSDGIVTLTAALQAMADYFRNLIQQRRGTKKRLDY